MPLCNLLWNRKVIIPVQVLLFCSFSRHPLLEHCDFNSVHPGRICFIPSARNAHMFPSLGISRTVSCIVKLSLSYLKGIRFLQCAWWEHCVKHRTASNRFAFPHPLVVHPENMVFYSCSLYLYVCHTHSSPSQKCREQSLCVGERAEWHCSEPAGVGGRCEPRAHGVRMWEGGCR